MPEPVTAAPSVGILGDAAIGFCGKLPARGDFVASGLPRRFVEGWHDWLQHALAASRDALGEDWVAAWLEAAIWRFALSPGVCGPDAMLGLWMPSVDRIGRYFPLTFAAAIPGADPAVLIREGGGFLAAAECAGRDALAQDLAPDAVAARLATAAAVAASSDAGTDPAMCPPAGALWWSTGSPRVPATAFATRSLPDAAMFAAMLDAGGLLSPQGSREPC
jgi:type VI secretion system protein ImpM